MAKNRKMPGTSAMSMGPVQMIVVGFDEPKFAGEIAAELNKLRASGTIRVLDMIAVQKMRDGSMKTMQTTDMTPEQVEKAGAIIGALMGMGAAGEEGAVIGAEIGAEQGASGHLFSGARIPEIADRMPPDSAAAVMLIEHRWAAPLRDAVMETGGYPIADTWIRPADLMAIGAMSSKM